MNANTTLEVRATTATVDLSGSINVGQLDADASATVTPAGSVLLSGSVGAGRLDANASIEVRATTSMVSLAGSANDWALGRSGVMSMMLPFRGVVHLSGSANAGQLSGNAAARVTPPSDVYLAGSADAGILSVDAQLTIIDPLLLSDLDMRRREFDVAALLQASADAVPVPSSIYTDSDRGGTDTPLDGELGLGTSQTLISRIRRQSSDALDTLTFNDNDNPETLRIGDYFDGEGADLSLTIQTTEGFVDLPPSAYRRGGGNFAHWTLTAEAQTLVDNIETGDRFIIAFWRTTAVANLSGSADARNA